MYTIKFTSEFKRQMKLCERRGYDMELLRTAIRILSTEGKLPAEYLPHVLHGNREVLVPVSMFPDIKRLTKAQREDYMIMDDQYFSFEALSKIYSVKDVLRY